MVARCAAADRSSYSPGSCAICCQCEYDATGPAALAIDTDATAAQGAGFVYLVPASLNLRDPAPAIAVSAAQAGVKVLIPYRPADMPTTAFSDGFHLNPQGATLYTQRAGPALRELLDDGASGAGVEVAPAAAAPPRGL